MSFPILYAKGTTTFSDMGIGVLTDCLKCSVTREINGEYELTMDYPVEGVHFADIQLESVILAKVPDKNDYQAFKIYSISKPIDMTITVDAEHVTYQTGDIPLQPFTNQVGGIDHILAAMNTIALPTGIVSPFTFSDTLPADSTIFTLKEPASMREVMSDIDGMLLSKDFYENCEWDYNNYNIILTAGLGTNKSDKIKYVYGVNVSDLSQNQSITNTITGIFPYVHAETDEGIPVNRLGNICYGTGYQSFANQRIAPTNVEEYFTDAEKEEWEADPATGIKMPTVAAVTAKGEAALKDFDYVCKPEVSLTINPVDLTGISGYEEVAENLKKVQLGDIISVIFEQYSIETDARIIKITYDVIDETNTSVEVGDPKPSLAATLASIGDKVEVNRAGIVVNRDSIISYVNKENGELGSKITQTEDMVASVVYGEMTAWNMVPITGSHLYTGGEEISIELYSKGDPTTWYNPGSEYDGYHYFDNLTGALWYCNNVNGTWRWDHYIWQYDHGKVASGSDTAMRAAADEDHWMYSWYNTSDNKVYFLERTESGSSYTYTWVLKDPQEIQLAGHECYAERMDVNSYSSITQTANQLVLKVDSNGHMSICELTASPDGGTQFNVIADDINFSGHTFNLSTDDMTIVSDTTRIDENGYVVYYLCDENDVGALPLAGDLYYNKKIVMAFQDGDAGWSLEDRSKNAKSELRGTNFSIEQMYDKEDWNAVTDEYLNDQSSFPGKTKAYLSMNPRWFGMYHKNDALSDTQKFDYRLGHFLQNGEVSETVGKIDQWWNGDSNPKNPDEAMFLMEKPDEASENFAMMVYDQIVMAGGQYTSKQSPRMFRIRSKLDPSINSVMRYNNIGISDYFYKKSPFQINSSPMYTLTNDGSKIVPGDNGTKLEDGCFIIVYDGPPRDKETITLTIYGGMNDTITIKDTEGTTITTLTFATDISVGVLETQDLDKFSTYRFKSAVYNFTMEHTIAKANDEVEVIPADVKWIRVANFPIHSDYNTPICKEGIFYNGILYATGLFRKSAWSADFDQPMYKFENGAWSLDTNISILGCNYNGPYWYSKSMTFAVHKNKLYMFWGASYNTANDNAQALYTFDGTTWSRKTTDISGNYFPSGTRFMFSFDGYLYMCGYQGIFRYNEVADTVTKTSGLPFDNSGYQAANEYAFIVFNNVVHVLYRYQVSYNYYPVAHKTIDPSDGSTIETFNNIIDGAGGLRLSEHYSGVDGTGESRVFVYRNQLMFLRCSDSWGSTYKWNPSSDSWTVWEGSPFDMQYQAPAYITDGNQLYCVGNNCTNNSSDQTMDYVYKYRDSEPPAPVVDTDWEILWQFSFSGDNGQILINSDFEAVNDLLTNSLTGDLLRSTYESSANNVYAQKNIVAKNGRTDGLSAFTNVSADQMFAAFSGYDRLIIAKSGSGISMPFEVGFHWQVAQSMQMCLVKQDGTFVPHDYYVTGEYVTVSLYGFTTTAFNGTLKYYYATDPGSSAHQEGWVELDASVAQNVTIQVNMFIVFAIPS